MDVFENNLSHLLAVFHPARCTVGGTAQLIGVDLGEANPRSSIAVEMKGITLGHAAQAQSKRTRAPSRWTLSRREANQGRFFRDVVKERLERGRKTTTQAPGTPLSSSAPRTTFSNTSSLALSPARDCHCEVFYLRFSLVPNEGDDIDNMLKAYKPQRV